MPIIKSTSLVEGQLVDIYIEVDREPNVNNGYDPYQNTRDGSQQRVAQAVQDVGDVFGEGITLARQCAAKAIQSFQQMHHATKPDELELQLGIKVGSEVGAVIPVIAKASGEAQIQVTMKWKLKETPQQLITNDTSQQSVTSAPK
ncbi:CU044_2847 family protein [Nostoc sp. PA-18-2419]|uniref:CU044_2847 family protein n=1 Tax=Nostoc sp. PA-18-2419 TaxID=2575443 RepID=UPI00110807E2|nr:CU044_2847 family protein [Nostoc sp. PA-18-2419]